MVFKNLDYFENTEIIKPYKVILKGKHTFCSLKADFPNGLRGHF